MTTIALIAAVAENGVIGNGDDLPWRIKSEWKYFARMTKGKPLIMGRKTFETLPEPLKDRPNIVVTRNADYAREGAIVATSLAHALDIARSYNPDEIMIGGGADIYRQALDIADTLYLTEIHLTPEGDTLFPPFNRDGWVETLREFHAAQAGEDADYTITVLQRK